LQGWFQINPLQNYDFKPSFNPSISIFFLDASKENLSVLHHPAVLGGSWQKKEQKLTALSGWTDKASKNQVIVKSIKQIQANAPLITPLTKSSQDSIKIKNPSIHGKYIKRIKTFPLTN
jgi:hypothetical protein